MRRVQFMLVAGCRTGSWRTTRRFGTRRSWLQSFGLFCVGRLWVNGLGKASQLKRGPDPEDQGVDRVPLQGHHGEGIQVVHVQDRGCWCHWRRFHWTLFTLLKSQIYRCHPVKKNWDLVFFFKGLNLPDNHRMLLFFLICHILAMIGLQF